MRVEGLAMDDRVGMMMMVMMLEKDGCALMVMMIMIMVALLVIMMMVVKCFCFILSWRRSLRVAASQVLVKQSLARPVTHW